jgi:hypothetical protein
MSEHHRLFLDAEAVILVAVSHVVVRWRRP